MSQLLSGKHKGRFGAPPATSDTTSPWRVVPLYFFVPLTVIFLAVSFPTWMGYYACGERHEAACVTGGSLRAAATGTMTGIVAFTGAALLVALLLIIVASIRVKKWPVLLVYAMVAIGFVLVVYTFLALNGSLATPAGQLGDLSTP